MLETIPRGPFTSIGLFHKANGSFLPLLLIQIQVWKQINIINRQNNTEPCENLVI